MVWGHTGLPSRWGLSRLWSGLDRESHTSVVKGQQAITVSPEEGGAEWLEGHLISTREVCL